jgi:cyclin D6
MILWQEKLLQCFNEMQDIVIDGYESVLEMVSSSVTAVNVLDQQFSSSESEKTDGTFTTTRPERDIKRRKIIDYCGNLTVQISRIRQY